MKYPKVFVLEVTEDDCYRAYVFGDSALQFALRRRQDVPKNARVGEFLLSMGDGWTYRVPVNAQRYVMRAQKSFLRGRTFTFENPFYIDPAISMKRTVLKPTQRLRAREKVRHG